MLKRRVKGAALALFHHGGGTSWTRRKFRNAVRILMYHRFPHSPVFESQCQHIKRYYHPVSLTQVSDWLLDGQPIPPLAVAVTVDDGYRDFLEEAFPVLEKYGIPSTVYLTTDLPDRNTWLWVDQVTDCFERTRVPQITLNIAGGGERKWALGTEEERAHSGFAVKELLKKAPNEDRLRVLEKLPGLLEVVVPVDAPASHAPLHWDDVRSLAKRGVDFGGHTRTHPILSRLADDGELEAEIAGSKQRIEREANITVRHFCYPNGTRADFTPRVIEAVKRSGFITAVIGDLGVNFAGANPFELKRIGVKVDHIDSAFAIALAGVGIRSSKDNPGYS